MGIRESQRVPQHSGTRQLPWSEHVTMKPLGKAALEEAGGLESHQGPEDIGREEEQRPEACASGLSCFWQLT